MSLLKLTNAPFEMEFNGKPYTIRKASLEQVVRFMQKAESYKTLPPLESGIKLVSYALFLLLSPLDNILTEEFITANLPGDCNPTEILIALGFIKPVPITPAARNQTTDNSSPQSPTAPDGLPSK